MARGSPTTSLQSLRHHLGRDALGARGYYHQITQLLLFSRGHTACSQGKGPGTSSTPRGEVGWSSLVLKGEVDFISSAVFLLPLALLLQLLAALTRIPSKKLAVIFGRRGRT